MLKKIIAIAMSFCFISEQAAFCQSGPLALSAFMPAARPAAVEAFRPMHLRYLQFDPARESFSLRFDKGDAALRQPELDAAAGKLMEYFLTGLTMPNKSFWVNLRPDSPQDVIDPDLSRTDLGRVLLEADLQLKKDTASHTSPRTAEGKEYWDSLYRKAEELFGTQDVTIPALVRPWIVPGEVVVREAGGSAYICKAQLKVMLEQDYLKGTAGYDFSDKRMAELNAYAAELMRKLVIPRITLEVNQSKKYAQLRQVYYSLVMAQWFKQRFRGEERAPRVIDSRDLAGMVSAQPWSPGAYFQAYQKSFKDGEYSIKETVASLNGQSARTYVSGGMNMEVGEFSSSPQAEKMLVSGTKEAETALGERELAAESSRAGTRVISDGSESRQDVVAAVRGYMEKLEPGQKKTFIATRDGKLIPEARFTAEVVEFLRSMPLQFAGRFEDDYPLNLMVAENLYNSYDAIASFFDPKLGLKRPADYLGRITVMFEILEEKGREYLEITFVDTGAGKDAANSQRKRASLSAGENFYIGGADLANRLAAQLLRRIRGAFITNYPLSTAIVKIPLNKMVVKGDGGAGIEAKIKRSNVLKPYFEALRKNSAAYDFGKDPEKDSYQLGQLFLWIATNENWETALDKIKALEPGGVYVGVGCGGQNFSWLSRGDFKRAYIVDINPYVANVYMPLEAMLMSVSGSRAEYLALLSGLKLTPRELAGLADDPGQNRRVQLSSIITYISSKVARENSLRGGRIDSMWQAMKDNFPAENGVREAALEFWQVFAGTGRVVDDAPVRVLPRKRFVRRLEIIGEALSRGDSWLSSEQNFLKIKRMFAEGRITGVWGSVASPEAFSPLTRELKKEGALVSLVYTSNINSWFDNAHDPASKLALQRNIAGLPRRGKCLLIESSLVPERSPGDTGFNISIKEAGKPAEQGDGGLVSGVLDISPLALNVAGKEACGAFKKEVREVKDIAFRALEANRYLRRLSNMGKNIENKYYDAYNEDRIIGPVVYNPAGGADVFNFCLDSRITDLVIADRKEFGPPGELFKVQARPKLDDYYATGTNSQTQLEPVPSVGSVIMERIIFGLGAQVSRVCYFRIGPDGTPDFLSRSTPAESIGAYRNAVVEFKGIKTGARKRLWYIQHDFNNGDENFLPFIEQTKFQTLLIKSAFDMFSPGSQIFSWKRVTQRIIEPAMKNEALVISDRPLEESGRKRYALWGLIPSALALNRGSSFGTGTFVDFGPAYLLGSKKPAEPVAKGSGKPDDGGAPGGIDMRQIEITRAQGAVAGSVVEGDPQKIGTELAAIAALEDRGMSPSGRRVKELVVACGSLLPDYQAEILERIIGIMRHDEEEAKPSDPELKEALALLGKT